MGECKATPTTTTTRLAWRDVEASRMSVDIVAQAYFNHCGAQNGFYGSGAVLIPSQTVRKLPSRRDNGGRNVPDAAVDQRRQDRIAR